MEYCELIHFVDYQLDSQVYDVSSFMDEHPGGDEVLLATTGKSAQTCANYSSSKHTDVRRAQVKVSTVSAFYRKRCNRRLRGNWAQQRSSS